MTKKEHCMFMINIICDKLRDTKPRSKEHKGLIKLLRDCDEELKRLS